LRSRARSRAEFGPVRPGSSGSRAPRGFDCRSLTQPVCVLGSTVTLLVQSWSFYFRLLIFRACESCSGRLRSVSSALWGTAATKLAAHHFNAGHRAGALVTRNRSPTGNDQRSPDHLWPRRYARFALDHRLPRETPSFFTIAFNVVRGIPSRFAATLITPVSGARARCDPSPQARRLPFPFSASPAVGQCDGTPHRISKTLFAKKRLSSIIENGFAVITIFGHMTFSGQGVRPVHPVGRASKACRPAASLSRAPTPLMSEFARHAGRLAHRVSVRSWKTPCQRSPRERLVARRLPCCSRSLLKKGTNRAVHAEDCTSNQAFAFGTE
jgi:hypothetical protein